MSSSAASDRRRRAGRGQATVELALTLPVVLVAALLVVQVGLLLRAQLLVTNAAREAARAAAVGEPPPPPAGLDPDRTVVEIHGGAGRDPPATGGDAAITAVTAEVRYRCPTDVPLVGLLVPDVDLTASVTMRSEAAP